MTRHLLPLAALFAFPAFASAADDPADFLLPNESLMTAFKERVPILFVTRNQPDWSKLAGFWNEGTEETVDPSTGVKVTRKAVRIKIPSGLTTAPPIPAENPMTVAKWTLGKKLYYDKILSTDGTVACATCHTPKKGFSDGKRVSTGIGGNLGPINSPTVFNAAYGKFQFWDGRAVTLEDQSQGPVGNNLEMFGGKADPWTEAIARIRAKPEYVAAFKSVFGHAPTRDAAAKAIATYERTVLLGTGIQDRVELVMRKRVTEEETGKFELIADDYVASLKAEFAAKSPGLKDIGLTDEAKIVDAAKSLLNGRTLFFGRDRKSVV